MLPAPLLVAFAWLLLWGLLDGLGRLTAALTGADATFDRPLGRLWLGFATLLALLLPWHLAAPIDGVTWLPALLLAGVGHARTRTHTELAPALARLAARPAFLAAAAALVAWTAVAASGPPAHGDDPLYFLQTVALSGRFPAIPGIGHLHHRLAFNHAHHLYVAFCDVGPFDGGGFHLANGLPFLSVALATTDALFGTARIHLTLRSGGPSIWETAPIGPSTLFAALLFPIVLHHAHGPISSATADELVFAFGTALSLLAVDALIRPSTGSAGATGPFWWLGAAAVVAKPSLVLVAAPVLAAMLWNGRRSLRAGLPVMLAATLFLVLPWMAHGVVLSGYPLFPATLLPLDVDWRLPHATVAAELDYVQAWGRHSIGSGDEDAPWLIRWVSRAWLFNLELLVPAVLAWVSVAWIAMRRRRPRLEVLTPLLVASTLAAGAWLAVTPDPRHAGVLPWLCAASLAVFASIRGDLQPSDGIRGAVAGFALVAALLDAHPLRPPRWHPSLEPPDAAPTRPYEAGPGTILQRATAGGCTAIDCTPTEVRTVLRVPGDFARGFRTAD